PHYRTALVELIDDEVAGDLCFVQVRSSGGRCARSRTQCRSHGRSWSARRWLTRDARRLTRDTRRLTGSTRRWLTRNARCWCAGLSWPARGRLLCWSPRLTWCARSWRRIRRRRLLSRSLRWLSKRAQRDEAETESKQCFHNFGGVEFTARHISFIPKQLDTSRAKVFTFLPATLCLGERHLYFASDTV